MTVKLTFGLLLAASLSACASTQPVLPQSQMAVAHNIAAQAITPPTAQKANTNIPADETLRAAARKRYRDGEVVEPTVQDTR